MLSKKTLINDTRVFNSVHAKQKTLLEIFTNGQKS